MATTNATNVRLAETLAKARKGSFTGLIIQLKGDEYGKGADRKVYGDDEVHVVIITGFRYRRLVERSLAVLGTIRDADIVAEAAEKGTPVTIMDVIDARVELTRSFALSDAGLNAASTDHVYEPLVVDGQTVVGCRVYKCAKGVPGHKCHCFDCNPTNPRAPKPGTVYLQGLQIGKKILTPAANGPKPEPNSAAKTIAKNLLRGKLPIRRYVSYPLDGDFLMREALKGKGLLAGTKAAIRADKDGVEIQASNADGLLDLFDETEAA